MRGFLLPSSEFTNLFQLGLIVWFEKEKHKRCLDRVVWTRPDSPFM